jgi:hypothetical protein
MIRQVARDLVRGRAAEADVIDRADGLRLEADPLWCDVIAQPGQRCSCK